MRVRIVTTTQNGTKHKELGLSTVESCQELVVYGSVRLRSYQVGPGREIDRQYIYCDTVVQIYTVTF